MQIKHIIASAACGFALLIGGTAASHAQSTSPSEIGSATGVNITYTGSTLTLSPTKTGSFSTYNSNGASPGVASTETFKSANGTDIFNDPMAVAGDPNATAFGKGTFTITGANGVLLTGSFQDLIFNEYGGNGAQGQGSIDLTDITYSGMDFPSGYQTYSTGNSGALTFNYPAASPTNFTVTDASSYYAVPSTVPEMSPAAIIGLGALALMGMFGLQGRSRRMGRAAS